MTLSNRTTSDAKTTVPLWFVRENSKVVYDRAVKNIKARTTDVVVNNNLALSFFNGKFGFEWAISPEGGEYWYDMNKILVDDYNRHLGNVDNYSII